MVAKIIVITLLLGCIAMSLDLIGWYDYLKIQAVKRAKKRKEGKTYGNK